eukprot:tig00020564_g11436.t1
MSGSIADIDPKNIIADEKNLTPEEVAHKHKRGDHHLERPEFAELAEDDEKDAPLTPDVSRIDPKTLHERAVKGGQGSAHRSKEARQESARLAALHRGGDYVNEEGGEDPLSS